MYKYACIHYIVLILIIISQYYSYSNSNYSSKKSEIIKAMINPVDERNEEVYKETVLFSSKELEMIYTIEEGKYLDKTRTTFDSTWGTISFGEQFLQEIKGSKQTKQPFNPKNLKHYQITVR